MRKDRWVDDTVQIVMLYMRNAPTMPQQSAHLRRSIRLFGAFRKISGRITAIRQGPMRLGHS